MYFNVNWRAKIRPTSLWKRWAYRIARPWLSFKARRHLSEAYVVPALKYVLPAKGMPLEDRRQWVNEFHAVANATILIQGTGTGWDVLSWAALKPKRIYAVDLFVFDEWEEIREYVAQHYGVEVIFKQADLESLSFLPSGTIDIVVSDAVYEHCRTLPAVLAETRRVLSSNGIIYASYGPLWYCAGGDHFSGRGGISHCYNHLRLTADDYHNYFNAYREPVEDFQSGGRYVEIDLFSKLTTRQFLATYKQAGLEPLSLILEVSPEALKYRKLFPQEFASLLKRFASIISVDDLLIKANFAILRKMSK